MSPEKHTGVTIAPTFFEQLFRAKAQAAHKMLVKLTTGVSFKHFGGGYIPHKFLTANSKTNVFNLIITKQQFLFVIRGFPVKEN